MEQIKKCERNVSNYPYFKFFNSMMIIGPILVPFMLWKGLNYSQIMLLQAISAISVFFFEVPTGTIADKLSRKHSLAMSAVCMAFGLAIYIVFKSFYLFALAEVIFGVGMTFSSGADAALLYESLVKLGKKKEYQKIEGNTSSFVFIGQGVGSLISGFLYKINYLLPFWISIVNIFISFLFSFRFSEIERNKSEHNYMIHVFKSISISIKTPRILWTVLFAAFMGFVFRSSFWLYQPYFKAVSIDIVWYGVIFFAFNMVAAFASKYLVKKYYDTRPRKVLISLGLLMGFSFMLPVIFMFPWAVVFLALQQIVRGLYSPTLRFYINHQIKDEYRATVISLVSLSASLSFAIFSPLVGISLDNNGTPFTYVAMAVISFGCLGFLVLLRRLQKLRKLRKV